MNKLMRAMEILSSEDYVAAYIKGKRCEINAAIDASRARPATTTECSG
jgi:hypothetical protein